MESFEGGQEMGGEGDAWRDKREGIDTVDFRMVVQNGKWHDVTANGDSKTVSLHTSIQA